ncbi:Uncharacterised protein [Klebsiella pneumoniae subsp. ozaenae]|uniref:Uncharacterized protein n=1 Tax=Klebsiella pneumoniae subsp. ozaenae TaxID=574 RepID=A0A378C590_KLEPO|nr:Uncharacterised protein [Klebsiella pneumoniae subsp. ozaenae]
MSNISVQLDELMTRKGYTQSHVARAIGRSPGGDQHFPERKIQR